MVKVIHSIWTKPMMQGKERWNISNQFEKNLWLFGYSVDYAKRIGLEIDLYTDTLGAGIFDVLGYDDVHIVLDELQNTNERFWAAGKVVALREAPLGTIHIDGDCFLKSTEIIPMLDMEGYDCIVQMEERLSIFMESYQQVLLMFQEAIGDTVKGLDYTLTKSLNAGIIGFNNQELKDAFINGYFKILAGCEADQKFMSLLKYDFKKQIEPNIVMEQYFLKGLCETEDYRIKNLIELTKDNFQDDVEEMNRQANAIGFAHAWGSSKYGVIPIIKDILAERNPKLFETIEKKIEDLKNV